MDLTQACFGGGKSEDEVNLDSGEGIEDMDDETLENMKDVLGETDFNRLYGHLL